MNSYSLSNDKKYYLMLCELHNPERHGKTEDSDPNIETHYLVYDKFDPVTGISYSLIDDYNDYDTDSEYDSEYDSESEISNNRLIRINDEIIYLKEFY